MVNNRSSKFSHSAPSSDVASAASSAPPTAPTSAPTSVPTPDPTSVPASAPTSAFAWFIKHDSWVKPYFAYYKKTLFLALLLGTLSIGFAAALMFTAGWLIAGSAEMPYSILLLNLPLLFVRIFGVGKPVIRYAERLTSHNWVFKMTSHLRKRLFEALNTNGVFFKSTHRLGDALGLLAEDIGHIQNLYLRTIFPTVIAWIIGLGLVIGLGCFTWWIALVFLLLVVIEMGVVPYVSALINGARQQQRKHLTTQLYADLTDNIIGISDWISSGREHDFMNRTQDVLDDMRHIERKAHRFDRNRDLILQFVFALGSVAIFAWAAWYFSGSVGGSSNWILAFVLGYFPLIDAVTPLPQAATEASAHFDAIKRMNNIGTTDSKTAESKTHASKSDSKKSTGKKTTNSKPSESKTPVSTITEIEPPYTIKLDNVSFCYGATPLIENLSLEIPQGQHLVLLGKSGTGKSTLASLIRGDLVPQHGSVTLGGLDTRLLKDEAPRWFGVIQQQTYLFNTTLRENLLLGKPEASDQQLIDILDSVGLSALLKRLDHGLDTMVDEAGKQFSGGERHRIALARVLLQDCPIIILDEPTVDLDPKTEKEVLETIFTTLRDKTIIMITHHLMGADYADRILFIQKGSILMDGAPEHLKETNRYYQKLWAFDKGLSIITNSPTTSADR